MFWVGYILSSFLIEGLGRAWGLGMGYGTSYPTVLIPWGGVGFDWVTRRFLPCPASSSLVPAQETTIEAADLSILYSTILLSPGPITRSPSSRSHGLSTASSGGCRVPPIEEDALAFTYSINVGFYCHSFFIFSRTNASHKPPRASMWRLLLLAACCTQF